MNRYEHPVTYAVWSKSKETRYNSTSGGAFSEFAKGILSEGGVVAGARYNEHNLVEHAIVDNYKGIEELRQSKYMSSSIGKVYKEIRAELEKGRLVAFCGSPCQVAGLYSFLRDEYEYLFTMDFICRGMDSPKAFKAWISEIENKERSKVTKVWFKYKEGGWKSSPRRTRLDFEDGSYKVYEAERNLYMHYLTSNLYIRPCCGDCKFKGLPRKSDVTFADFWGIEEELDDDRGTSVLLINSEKGREYFEKVKDNMEVYEKDFNAILGGNPMFSTSVVIPPKAHDFLVDLDNMVFSQAIKKYLPTTSLWRKVARKAKRFIETVLRRA